VFAVAVLGTAMRNVSRRRAGQLWLAPFRDVFLGGRDFRPAMTE
jgi:hypothetical protein